MMENPPEDARRKISVDVIEAPPDDSPVTFDIETVNRWITPDSTAEFSITTSNNSGSERRIGPAFYKDTSDEFGVPGIVVYNKRARDFNIPEYTPPCFSDSLEEEYVESRTTETESKVLFTRAGVGPEPIGSEEERVEEFIVADDPTVDGCFPPDEYTFEKRHMTTKEQRKFSFKILVEEV